MAKSKRKTIELAICDALFEHLGPRGYSYKRDGASNRFYRRVGGVDCYVEFYLTGTPTYYYFSTVWVIYDLLSVALRGLLAGTEYANATVFGPSGAPCQYWPAETPHAISDIEDVETFVENYMVAFLRLEDAFLLPYCDETKAARECLLFYTKWPGKMSAIPTAILLIAFGVKYREVEKVRLGIERIDAKFWQCRTDEEREYVTAIRERAVAFLDAEIAVAHARVGKKNL